MPDYLRKIIVQNPKIHSGMPIIAGTRVTVAEIIDFIEEDHTITDTVKVLKKAGVLVTPEEVKAALEFAKYRVIDETYSKKASK